MQLIQKAILSNDSPQKAKNIFLIIPSEKRKRKYILHTKDTINTVNSFFPPYTKAFETRMGFICVEIQVWGKVSHRVGVKSLSTI